jgi:threonine synthase
MVGKMEVLYSSTRNKEKKVTASQAILKGLSEDGGLFVPDHIPALDMPLKDLAGKSYQEVAYEVMKLFLSDFTEEELKGCIEKAYDSKFDTEVIAPIVEAEGTYYLELFHGATIAFKDMALSILPHLMITSAKKNHVENEIVILTATSGDTGKAALAGFAGVKGTKIIVFYPKNGVSPIQEKQMVTQKGDNTFVVGIHGNFDDAQTGVKKLFNDKELAAEMEKAGMQFSSANSINIGRLLPQLVYYVYAYVKLLEEDKIKEGEKINIVVPTGNFGNILAAFYAKNMGLPVAKLICASNENKVLFDFFETGSYDKNREFVLTSSPSMDILISSNLERLIYWIAGNDAEKNKELMNALTTDGKYEISSDMRDKLKDFYANYATEEETAKRIKALYENTGYILDTHTAVASVVYEKYQKDTKDPVKTVIASTASPFKFTRSVMDAIDQKYDAMSDFELVDELSRIGNIAVPKAIEEIRTAPVVHDNVCDKTEMKETVKKFLGL